MSPAPRPAPPFAIVHFPPVDGGGELAAELFAEPVDVIAARSLDEVRPALARVERAAAAGAHAVGYVAYDAAPAFDPALRVAGRGDGALPLLWFGIFDAPRGAGTLVPAPSAGPDVADWVPSVSRD